MEAVNADLNSISIFLCGHQATQRRNGYQAGEWAITEAACWSHGRRKFFVLADVAKAPLAIEAVRRIGLIFDVERDINGLEPDQRHAVRQERSCLWSQKWKP